MDVATLVLVLLLTVVGSGIISRALPGLPPPFVQIALGAAVGAFSDAGLPLDPEVFLFVFVPPLLFLDGWRIPNDELLAERGAVLRLAFGLVVFTVLGLGAVIHLMIPAMPWSVAFALAAAVSPTDPVAVSAIAGRVAVPRRMMRILQGEALLNDAAGLASLRVAVVATVSGTFSLATAAATFLWMALGGAAIGAALGLLVVRLRTRLGGVGEAGEDAGASILTALLIPFVAYLAAERLECSGVLAAASAGISVSVALATSPGSASLRIRSRGVWDMLEFVMNGAMFALLGEQLPNLARRLGTAAAQVGGVDPWSIPLYVLALTAALAALRFAWVWGSLHAPFRRRGGSGGEANWRAVGATTVAGAKGALTLAAVLSLPIATEAGAPFPARDLAIVLATGVILVSLVAAAIGLPALLRGIDIPPDRERIDDRRRARLAAARAALEALDEAGAAEDDPLVAHYRRRASLLEGGKESVGEPTELFRMRERGRQALRAERSAVRDLMRARRIGLGAGGEVLRELDMDEVRLGTGE